MGRDRYTKAFDHHNMTPAPAAVATVRTIWNTEDGIMVASGITVPTDSTTGYAEGCIFVHVDGSAGSMLYVNEGSGTLCDFNPLLTQGNTGDLIDAIETYDLATAADDKGPSPLLWDSAPVLEVMLDPGKGFHVFEDFLNSLTEAETGGTLTQTTGSGTFTDLPSVAAGVMVLDNAANTANHATSLAYINMQCKPGVGTHIYFEARVKVGVDTGGLLIGLCDDSTADVITASIPTNTDHAVFFRDEGMGTAAIGTQACDGSGITSSSTTITDSDKDAYENFGIHIFGDGNTAGDYVKFYHLGALVATVTDADGGGDDGVPDAVICPTFAVDNMGDTIQSTLTIDWMRLLVYNAISGTVRA